MSWATIQEAFRYLTSQEEKPYRLLAVIGLEQIAFLALIVVLVQSDYLVTEQGLGASFSGYILTAIGGTKLLTQTPGGWLADRFGYKRMLVIGLWVSVGIISPLLFFQHPASFLAVAALYGLARAIVSPASFAIIADNYGTEQRGKIAALTNLGYFIGFAMGAVVGIGLSDFAPFQVAVVTSMTFSVLAAFVAMRYLKEPASKVQAKNFGLFAGWPLRVLLAPQLIMWGVIVLTISLGVNLLTPVIGPYAREHLQLDLYQFVPFLVPAALLGLLSIIPAGHLSDRLGRYQPLLGGLSIGAVALILASFVASAWVLMFIAIPVMLAYTISVPAISAVMMDLSQRGSRGVVLGALTAVQGIGGTIGPPIGGHAFDAFGPTVPFQLAAVMLGVAVVMGLYYAHWRANGQYAKESKAV